MPKHFIAGNGSYGCLYDHCEVFDTARDAVNYIATTFELSREKTQILRAGHYVDLPRGAGADYAEITPCDCEDKSVHEDS